MVLHLIGLGLGEIEDLTIYGQKLMKTCSKLYLLASRYHPCNKKELETYLSQNLVIISTDNFEEQIPSIALESQGETLDKLIGILMPGNPFCDNFFPKIKLHCDKLDVNIKIVHNMSYMNAMGNSGIQLYKFGETVFVDGISNDELKTHFRIINSNLKRKLNTLLIFNKKVDSNLPIEFLTSLSQLEDEKDRLCSSSDIVLLFKKEEKRQFNFGSSLNLLKENHADEIEALAVCSEFDCVEEEYLKEMKSFREGAREANEKSGIFSVVGLGLGKPEDITLKGRELIKRSGKVFLEGYTSIMLGGQEELSAYFEKEIIVADREMVEQNSDQILDHLKSGQNVSFLVVGDPFGATTHTDIILRSLEKARDVVIANNASIINALGLSGLKPSRFGGIVSIPFWAGTYEPDSFYDKISANSECGWHTLCLLDIQVKEQSFENLARGRKIYEKPRYMSSSVAARQLLASKEKRLGGSELPKIEESTKTMSLTRIGTHSENVPCLSLGSLPETDLGPPLHSLIIVGELDEDERHSIKL